MCVECNGSLVVASRRTSSRPAPPTCARAVAAARAALAPRRQRGIRPCNGPSTQSLIVNGGGRASCEWRAAWAGRCNSPPRSLGNMHAAAKQGEARGGLGGSLAAMGCRALRGTARGTGPVEGGVCACLGQPGHFRRRRDSWPRVEVAVARIVRCGKGGSRTVRAMLWIVHGTSAEDGC